MVSKALSMQIADNLAALSIRIQQCLSKTSKTQLCELVAVSKTKPISDIQAAYEGGQRHFGENYVDEFIEKITSKQLPKDINWHFIGHIQSNKAKKLIQAVQEEQINLLIETVDSQKLAKTLNKECEKVQRQQPILVQVLSSDEDTKHGIDKDQLLDLIGFIKKECPFLECTGLMSMGKLHDIEGFQMMYELRKKALEQFQIDEQKFILSMGTSADFEEAIIEGATEIRVGTILFGERDYSIKQ